MTTSLRFVRTVRRSGLFGLALLASACGGSTSGSSEGASRPNGPASSSTSPSEAKEASSADSPSGGKGPATTTPSEPSTGGTDRAANPPPSPDTREPFDLGAALGAGFDWSLAERVNGDGWLHFAPDSEGLGHGAFQYTVATADTSYGGIFSCGTAAGTYDLDATARKVTLHFPAPCRDYSVWFDSDRILDRYLGSEFRTDFRMRDEKYGIDSTEGITFAYTAGHCDAGFTTCWP
ncbi:MAG: hypothetical protein U0169_19580 [Polyangiaceae bacterium]